MKKPPRARAWYIRLLDGGALVAFWPLLVNADAPEPMDDAIRRELKAVYERPEFQPSRSSSFWRWLERNLEAVMRWLGGLYRTAPILYWVLLVGCLLLLGLLIGHIIWTVRRVLFVGAGRKAEEDRGDRVQLSASHRAEALRRAGLGEYTEAIRYLFLSLVYFFDESGRVSFQRAYTNREYLRLFADRPRVQDDLRVFVDTLDRDWYGERPTTREQYDACLALYDSLK
jgi:Domain of unknown function (DUF4129)